MKPIGEILNNQFAREFLVSRSAWIRRLHSLATCIALSCVVLLAPEGTQAAISIDSGLSVTYEEFIELDSWYRTGKTAGAELVCPEEKLITESDKRMDKYKFEKCKLENAFVNREDHIWSAHEWAKTLSVMHEVAEPFGPDVQAEYADALYNYARVVLKYRDDLREIATEDAFRGRVMKGWGVKYPQYQDDPNREKLYVSPTAFGIYGHVLAMFARLVSDNAELHDAYGREAVRFVNEAAVSIADIPDNEWEFSDNGLEAAIRVTPAFQKLRCNRVESAVRDDCITDKEYASRQAEQPYIPYNKVHAIARAMIDIIAVMDSDLYHGSPERMNHEDYHRYRMWMAVRLSQLHAWWTRKAIYTEYTQDGIPYYIWEYKRFGRLDDISHGDFTLDYFAELVRSRGLVENILYSYGKSHHLVNAGSEQLERFAMNMLLKSTSEIEFMGGVDGSPASIEKYDKYQDSCQGWLELSVVKPEVFDRCHAITLRTIDGKQPYVTISNFARLLRMKPYRYPRWLESQEASGSWSMRDVGAPPLMDVAVGDFDCDNQDDLFHGTGDHWEFSSGAQNPWEHLINSRAMAGSLAFGDFDGDGCTDVFRPDGSIWWYSSKGQDGWKKINVSATTLDSLVFGDFNGNGTTDVVRSSKDSNGNGIWVMSEGGQTAWTKLNTSNVDIRTTVLGDWDGNGTTDVLRVSHGKWYISFNGSGSWQYAGSFGVMPKAVVGNFDGVPGDELLITESGVWTWRSGRLLEEVRSWNISNISADKLIVGDWNGDGVDDVLRRGN